MSGVVLNFQALSEFCANRSMMDRKGDRGSALNKSFMLAVGDSVPVSVAKE